MVDYLFVGLVVLYVVIAAKVDQWITIASIGFKSETPQWFLVYPRAYDLTRSFFFLAATVTLYKTELIPWYFGLVVLLGAWFAAGLVGQTRAFETYRQLMRECVEEGETSEDRAWRIAESSKTDAELRDKLLRLRRSKT